MRGVCAIVLAQDGTFIASAGLRGRRLCSFRETVIPLAFDGKDILAWLRKNSETLNQAIKNIEGKSSLRMERVFLQLPRGLFDRMQVEEDVPLKRRKKITSGDIIFVKNYLEDKFLEWDDHCLHNIVIGYDAEGKHYNLAPLGASAKKIKLQSLLIKVKDRLYREVEAVFDNLDRHFGGFVAQPLGVFSAVFTKKDRIRAVVNIGYDNTYIVIFGCQNYIFEQEFSFGLKPLIAELGKRFLLPFHLAQEVFERYFSFKETPFFKEVTVKKEDEYLNLSTHTLNTFIKDYVRMQVQHIVKQIEEVSKNNEFILSFTGRLNSKEGFYGFLNSFISQPLKAAVQNSELSSSYGCLRYGVNPFLENDHKRRLPLIQRIRGIYKEYF